MTNSKNFKTHFESVYKDMLSRALVSNEIQTIFL